MKSPEERVASIKAKYEKAQALESKLNSDEKIIEFNRRRNRSKAWKMKAFGTVVLLVATYFLFILPQLNNSSESSYDSVRIEEKSAPKSRPNLTMEEEAATPANQAEEIDREATELSTEKNVIGDFVLIESDEKSSESPSEFRTEVWQSQSNSNQHLEMILSKAEVEQSMAEVSVEHVEINNVDVSIYSTDKGWAWFYQQNQTYYYGQGVGVSLNDIENFLLQYIEKDN